MKIILRCVLIAVLLLLTSCNNVPVAEDISQTEANQIIAVLARHGIYAVSSKAESGKSKYNVEVNNSFYIQAKSILVEKSLPKGDKASFEDLVEARGLLPNSREIEALRLDHAMAIEMEEALNSHPDIAGVKVVIRSHGEDSGNERAISIIIQEKLDRTLNQEEIKAIAKKTTPGLKDENIIITIAKESAIQDGKTLQKGVVQANGQEIYVPLTHFMFNWQVPEADYNAIVIVLIICLFVIAIIGWLVGFWFGYFKNSKQIIDAGLPDLSVRMRLDRPDRSSNTEV